MPATTHPVFNFQTKYGMGDRFYILIYGKSNDLSFYALLINLFTVVHKVGILPRIKRYFVFVCNLDGFF